MRIHYRHLTITTTIAIAFLAVALFISIKEVKSTIAEEKEARQKLEWRMNTIGVAERVEVDPNNRVMKCSLEVVICEEEKYELKLQ